MQDQVLSDKLSSLKEKIEGELKQLKSSKELYEFKNLYLEGKKSKISELMKEMRNLAPEERAGYGKAVNELKEWAIDRFVQKLGRIAPAFGLGQQNATHRMAPLSLGSCSPNRGACKAHCQKHSSTIGIIRRFVRLRVANKA